MQFFTVGVYNSTAEDFFNKLVKNDIDTFCDIRQRRAVRGSKYSFVNSTRLQNKLKELGIKYKHILALAPTSEIRELQKKTDLQKKQLKSERKELGEVFISEYKERIINKFDFVYFLKELKDLGANKIVLFCVEEQPAACHRSLVTNVLKERFDYNIIHL